MDGAETEIKKNAQQFIYNALYYLIILDIFTFYLPYTRYLITRYPLFLHVVFYAPIF